jgi:hypothetical protein
MVVSERVSSLISRQTQLVEDVTCFARHGALCSQPPQQVGEGFICGRIETHAGRKLLRKQLGQLP